VGFKLISLIFDLIENYRPKPNELLPACALADDPEKPPNGKPPPNDCDEAAALALDPEKPPPPNPNKIYFFNKTFTLNFHF
jgi:hypothetical protein